MTWWAEMQQAAQRNKSSALVAASFDHVPVSGLATAIATRMPYSFDGQQKTETWEGCLRRGFGACADAAALVVAIAARRGKSDHVRLCFEEHPQYPNYAHVRAVWDTTVVDPYPEQSLRVTGCSRSLPAAALLQAPRWL